MANFDGPRDGSIDLTVDVATLSLAAAFGPVAFPKGLPEHLRQSILDKAEQARRHAHAVWSRIDPDTMTAKPLPFFKRALNGIARELYLENGWSMPEGFRDSRLRDPRSFTLAEWQQAKRAGIDAREVKGAVQEAWAISADMKARLKNSNAKSSFSPRRSLNAARLPKTLTQVFEPRLSSYQTLGIFGRMERLQTSVSC